MPVPTLNIAFSIGGLGTSLSKNKTITDEGDLCLEVEIANGQTNKLIAAVLDVSQVKGLVLMATKEMTLKTNDTGLPGNTIVLQPNIPRVFTGEAGEVSPLTVDVTAFYVTNASGEDGTFHAKAIYDATV